MNTGTVEEDEVLMLQCYENVLFGLLMRIIDLVYSRKL